MDSSGSSVSAFLGIGALRRVRRQKTSDLTHEPLKPGEVDRPVAVSFEFETRHLVVEAVAEDDTVRCRIGGIADPGWEDVSTAEPWDRCVGHVVTWAWILGNSLGYVDGVQLEFDDHDQTTVQLMTWASALEIARVVAPPA